MRFTSVMSLNMSHVELNVFRSKLKQKNERKSVHVLTVFRNVF